MERRTKRRWIRFQSRPGDGDEGSSQEDDSGADEAGDGVETEGDKKKKKKKKKKRKRKKKRKKKKDADLPVRKDPVEAQFAVIDKYHENRSTSDRLLEWVPFSRARKARLAKQTAAKKLTMAKGRHAVFSRQRALARIRVGVDDIKIVLGELGNKTMEAEQRTNIRAKRLYYTKIDMDLRQQIRFQTNDDLCVYIWYRRSSNARLVCDIKIGHGWSEGHKQWEIMREMGYEKVESNVDANVARAYSLDAVAHGRVDEKNTFYDTPIETHHVFSGVGFACARNLSDERRILSKTRKISRCLASTMVSSFGAGAWKSLTTIFLHSKRFETRKREIFATSTMYRQTSIPASWRWRLGPQRQNWTRCKKSSSTSIYQTADVRKLNTKFCHLANTKLNPDARLSLDELFFALGFEYGAKELGRVLHEIIDLAHVELTDDNRFMDFVNYLRLLRTWCIMEPDHLVRFFFNLIDPLKGGLREHKRRCAH